MNRIITHIVAAVALMASSAGYADNGDSYNASANTLTIPSIAVGSTTYTNVVISIGSILSVGGSSTPAPAAPNYSGSWLGTYGGYALTYTITQNGNNITAVSTSPLNSVQQTATGTLSGNTAALTINDSLTYGTGTLTFFNSSTLSATQNSCTPRAAQCALPNGTTITFTKQ